MRFLVLATAALIASPSMAQTSPASGTAAKTAAAATAAGAPKAKYNTTDTEIGTMLDTPALKAVLDKQLPSFTSSDQIDMARMMTLRSIQQYTPDILTDAKLDSIDADLAKVK